ncbi:MAG: primosomal protein N' [Negativicutes bacterium]|jgi:primosomal protein N' (replication factor Y)
MECDNNINVAEVFVNLPAKNICKQYSYSIPATLAVCVGQRVVVPFGNRTVEGVVVAVNHGAIDALKPLTAVIGDWFDATLIELAKKTAEYYLCSISETLKLFIPGGSSVKKNIYKDSEKNQLALELTEQPVDLLQFARKPAQARLLERLLRCPALLLADAKNEGHGAATINTLERAGFIRKTKQRIFRDSYQDVFEQHTAVILNHGQQNAVDKITAAISQTSAAKFLLYGVTGSGKTEVYLRAAKRALDNGKQSVVLVPEIALTAQLVERFKAFFGERIGVAHSRLSAEERRDIFDRARAGTIDVLIGARSAIFAPFKALGLIVIDEEHEYSYKQDDRPYYNAKQVAIWRSELSGAPIVFGSATPSIETFYAASCGEFELLELPKRATGALMPEIRIVDMCEQFAQSNRSMFSEPLKELLTDTLAKGEQAIILLNRRGHSTFVSCRECGYVARCQHCDVSLTYHDSGSNLRCHYCGYSERIPDECPTCKSQYIRYFGTGTQKVEEELKKHFPTMRVLRMDQDTVSGKRGHEKIINMFRRHEYDVLVGTQMVAKGHDIVNVSAVGIISADTALNLPDFRAHERTFALLTQAAGRAGRGEIPGKVVVQSYNSSHFTLISVANSDYLSYYTNEIDWRRQLGYPPFVQLAKIVIHDTDEAKAINLANSTVEKLHALNPEIQIVGPAPALLARLNGDYRQVIIVKAKAGAAIRAAIHGSGILADKKIDVDVDPISVI